MDLHKNCHLSPHRLTIILLFVRCPSLAVKSTTALLYAHGSNSALCLPVWTPLVPQTLLQSGRLRLEEHERSNAIFWNSAMRAGCQEVWCLCVHCGEPINAQHRPQVLVPWASVVRTRTYLCMYSQRLVGILRLRSELERRKHANRLSTKSYSPIYTVRY